MATHGDRLGVVAEGKAPLDEDRKGGPCLTAGLCTGHHRPFSPFGGRPVRGNLAPATRVTVPRRILVSLAVVKYHVTS